MSTVSTVTASAEIDPTLGDDTESVNWICMLVATHGKGTPLCSTSFKEEDVVKLCMRSDQEHPEGELQLLDTDTVLALWHDSDMMATMYCLAAATVWCGDPIRLYVLPSMPRQVRDYT